MDKKGDLILGIDPGYAIVGYGVIRKHGADFTPVCYGTVETDAGTNFCYRLEKIYDGISELITRFSPVAVAVEKLYFQNNQKTAIDVAQARGVITLCAVKHGIEIHEYTPLQVKQAVTGYGKADKNQVQQMTKSMLHLKDIPKPDDAADALAVALCHGTVMGSLLRI
jgi:crossover junction endodeoxyribonuclease RuvC